VRILKSTTAFNKNSKIQFMILIIKANKMHYFSTLFW